MMRWPWFSTGKNPVMQTDTIFEELAAHIAAQTQGAEGVGPFLTGRDVAVQYVTLSRAVTLISALCAALISTGGLTVRDRQDNLIDNRRTRKILQVLSHSPDGGETSSFSFIEDVFADYCLDGNALISADHEIQGGLRGLTRYSPFDAFVTQEAAGPSMYTVKPVNRTDGAQVMIPARAMVHMRWPMLRRNTNTGGRNRFAQPTTALLSRALGIGISQEDYIGWWFREAPKSGLHFDITAPEGVQFTREQMERLQKNIEERAKAGRAVVTQATKSARLSSTAQDSDVKELREFQVREIAGFFGLPLPLLSMSIGQWTRGINEQVMKMAWRTGIKPHLDRFLAVLALGLLQPGERFYPDIADFVRGDSASTAELVMALQGDAQRNPTASRSELRHLSGLPHEPAEPIADTVVNVVEDKPNAN